MSDKLKKLLGKATFGSCRSKRYGSDNSCQPSANDGGSSCGRRNNYDGDGSDDVIDATSLSLMWWRDNLRHSCGEFSCATIQANQEMEDHCQVETGMNATFAGVYDGHCCPQAAKFIKENLFQHLINITQELSTMSCDVLKYAIGRTEDEFLAHAETTRERNPLVAITGSCCLVALIWKGTLYIANVGDSRAVIGSTDSSNKIIGEQLTREHNAMSKAIRDELKVLHPNDASIMVEKNDAWRVKGISKVTRSIGDAFLKRPGFTVDPSVPQKYLLSEPISRAVLTAEPSMHTRALTPKDQFIILGSHGFWDFLSVDTAIKMVHTNPPTGIARKLLRACLDAINAKYGFRFQFLDTFGKGSRRKWHDDMSVIVIFLDNRMLGMKDDTVPEASHLSFVDSKFKSIREMM